MFSNFFILFPVKSDFHLELKCNCKKVFAMMFVRVSRIFIKANEFSIKYPVIRGMVSYGTIWPSGCFLQQIIAGDERFDCYRAARFSLYGCFYVAPTINVWLTIARTLWPKNDIKSALIKVGVPVNFSKLNIMHFFTLKFCC